MKLLFMSASAYSHRVMNQQVTDKACCSISKEDGRPCEENDSPASNPPANDQAKVSNQTAYKVKICRLRLDNPDASSSLPSNVCNGEPNHNPPNCFNLLERHGEAGRSETLNLRGPEQVLVGSNNLGGGGARENEMNNVNSHASSRCDNGERSSSNSETPNRDQVDSQRNRVNGPPLLGNNIAPNVDCACRCDGPCRISHPEMNLPSTSNSGGLWNNVWKDDVEKCPSKVRNGSLEGDARRRLRNYGSSDEESWSGNEGEESYVYTYKGSLQADLPRSFHTLDRIANAMDNPPDGAGPARPNRSGSSSPDNDFLEMDFDPGPSLDLDESEDQEMRVSPIPELPMSIVQLPDENDLSADNASSESDEILEINVRSQPGPSRPPYVLRTLPLRSLPMQTCPTHRTWSARDSWGHHCSSGDLCSPLSAGDSSESDTPDTLALWNSTHSSSCTRPEGEPSDPRKYNLFSDLYHCIMAKRLVMEKNASLKGESDSSPEEHESPPLERTMIWTEQEACAKQVTQISTSACGATAVINAMMALNFPFALDKVKKGVNTRLRQENAPLPQYLQSRSGAGASHDDIIRGIEVASDGRLYARFFHMYPERRFCLRKWLSYWLSKGAVPIATLNLQAGLPPGAPIPDAWHHQMIFGVSRRGVFLTNPLECVVESALMPQLCSPSVLKVKRSDVIQRWTNSTDLTPLFRPEDLEWKKLNVLGQVVNMVRESMSGNAQGRVVTSHITIPAVYKSGVTLIIPADSPHCELLRLAPELPFLVAETQPPPQGHPQ